MQQDPNALFSQSLEPAVTFTFLTTICAHPGTLPPDIGNLVKLEQLYLADTALSGEFSKIYPLDQHPQVR